MTIARLRRELETAESERAAALAMGARHESQLEEATRTVSADQAALSAARAALAESEAETAKLREPPEHTPPRHGPS